jgi:hypothetical protein
MESLHVDGYAVLRKFATPVRDYYVSLAEQATPIFNDNPTEHRNDNLRCQLTLRGPMVGNLRNRLQELFPAHTAKDWVLLKSLPGCRQQAAHTDYVPSPELHVASDDTVPLLFLLAVEDNTRLEVWPRSHRPRRYPIMQTTVTLSAGDALIFRGDLVHAGSAYSDQNVRIHAYLDHPAVPRDPNRTWIIYKHADDAFRRLICE